VSAACSAFKGLNIIIFVLPETLGWWHSDTDGSASYIFRVLLASDINILCDKLDRVNSCPLFRKDKRAASVT